MRISVLFVFLLSSFFWLQKVEAQSEPHFCGTTGKTKWLIEYQKNRQAYTEFADTNWLYVPVTFHIVGQNNGTGYFPIQRVFKALCHMNSQYESARIKCYLHPTLPFNYLNNTDWYAHGWEDGEAMIKANNIDDRVNAYIVDDPAGNCGYSWFDAIVLGKNCSSETNSTWGHELGHHLSLPHPFYGWEGRSQDPNKPAPASLGWGNPVEKVARINCLDAGDGFCDTEPDYISNRWNCQNDGRSSQFLDPDSVAFKSDGSYIMGYANDGCQNRFMPDQQEAMRANLNTEHALYLVTDQHGPTIADDAATVLRFPIDSVAAQYNSVTFTWDALPGAQYYVLEIGLFANFTPMLATKVIMNTNSYAYTSALPKNRNLYWRVRAYSDWDVCEDQSTYQVGVFKSVDFSATNELERTLQLELYPNPASVGQDVQVQITADRSEQVEASLFDINGRQVWSGTWNIYAGDQTVLVPTAQLAGSQYRFTLQNSRGIISRTISVFE
jgi:hypothetical protein